MTVRAQATLRLLQVPAHRFKALAFRLLTLKKEAAKPPGKNVLQLQAKFDRFIGEYTQERPHQALGMRYPSELYTQTARRYQGLRSLEYPLHDATLTVTQCGRLCFGGRKINLSVVFAGQNVGVREIADHVWLVSFMHYDLGFFDDQECRVECAPNPFGANVLPMSPE
jgi:putative transposase